jgi:hypothetical protein
VTPNGDGDNVYTPPPSGDNLDGNADETTEAPTMAPTAAPTAAPTEKSVYTPPPYTKPDETRSSSSSKGKRLRRQQ